MYISMRNVVSRSKCIRFVNSATLGLFNGGDDQSFKCGSVPKKVLWQNLPQVIGLY